MSCYTYCQYQDMSKTLPITPYFGCNIKSFFPIQSNLYIQIYYFYYNFYMVKAYNSIAIVFLQNFFSFHHNNCFTNDPAKCMPKMAAILNFGGHLDFFH